MTDEWSAAVEAPGEPPAPPPAPAEQPVKRGRPTGPSLRKLLTQTFPDGASMNDLVNAGYGGEFKRHLDAGEVEMNAEGVYRWVGKVLTELTVPPEEPAAEAKLTGELVIADPENLQFHALAAIFPIMTPAGLNDLTEDVREHGLRDPIEIYNGQIVEGRNRFVACKAAGVPPRFTALVVPDDAAALAYVISKNLKRRHLDESQRAMVANRIANMRRGDNQHASIEATSQSEAAEMLNVSRSAVQRAATVVREGVPEVADAVDRGELAVSAAEVIAKQPPEVQQEILRAPKAERTKKVSALRTPRKPEPVSPPADHPARAVRLVPWDPAASKVAFSEADWTKDDLRALRDVIDEIVGTPVLQ